MKKYDVEMRMQYDPGDFSDWECFDGIDEGEYSAEEYIADAVEGRVEVAEMMARGEIEDFVIRIADAKSGEVIESEWASSLYPDLYRSEAAEEEEY